MHTCKGCHQCSKPKEIVFNVTIRKPGQPVERFQASGCDGFTLVDRHMLAAGDGAAVSAIRVGALS